MNRAQESNRSFKLSVWALVVSIVLSAANLGYQIYRDHTNRVSNESRFGKIETAVRMLTGVAAPQLQKAVDDSLLSAVKEPRNAKDKIEYAGKVIRQLRQANVSLPAQSIAETSDRVANVIAADRNTPEAWVVAAEFITYRSALSDQDLANLQRTMPLCVSMPPQPATVAHNTPAGSTSMDINPAHYDNCQIELDSPQQDSVLSVLAGSVPVGTPLVFKHCLVIYNGGVVRLQVNGPVTFENCLWKFSVSAVPPASGQKITEALLASNQESFRFPKL